MRFFEYEAREIVEARGIPVTDYGFANDARRRRARSPRDIGGPGRHQVPGADRRADEGRRRAVRRHARGGARPRRARPRPRDQRPHAARRARRPARPRSSRSTTRAWSGTGSRKQPVMLFSDMGGIDIEEVAEEHPDHVGRRHFSTSCRSRDFQAKEVHRLGRGHRRAAQPATPILTAAGPAVRRVRHDAGRDQPARRARGRLVRRARRAHGHGERGPRRARRRCSTSSASATRRPARRARPTPFELAGEEVDAMDHRGVAGNVTEFDGNLGLVIGAGGGSLTLFDAVRAHGGDPANYCEIGGNPSCQQGVRAGQARAAEARRGQDRGDDVDRLQHARGHRRARRDQGVPGAGLRPGREDRDLPHPGRLGGGGLQDPRAATASTTPTARVSLNEAARRAVEKIQGSRRS